MKVKQDFTNASHRALQTQDAIAAAETVKPEKVQVLKDMLQGLKDGLTPWASQFMMASDVQKMKRDATSQRLSVELEGIGDLKKKIEAVTELTNNLWNAHALLL